MATRKSAGKQAATQTASPAQAKRARRPAAKKQTSGPVRPAPRQSARTADKTSRPAAPPPPQSGASDAWLGWAQAETAALPSFAMAPETMLKLQSEYFERVGALWRDFIEHPAAAGAAIDDPRFADPAWTSNPLAAFTARAYLLNSEFMNRLADSVEADDKARRRLRFAVSQWVEAASPANYLALNPKAQQTLIETRGESLKAGVAQLLADFERGKISQSDESAFAVGRNLATTPGAVVFENPLIQLIQYSPTTAKVRKRPFLIVPPCINKFYILDLQPENSFVRYAVEQGNTVFLISWKNPHEAERFLTWDDYIGRGVIEAIRAVQAISGEKQINALGFCVGGTLIATALGVLAARGEQVAASLTLMTALLDFADTGVLDVFVDEATVKLREETLGQGGLMSGRDLANTFASLRPRDLIWNYVVSNYLEGQAPAAFDLLYWNGDSTNLPGPMYAWYLRHLYLQNELREPGVLTVCGQALDLSAIEAPVYVFGAREDHIVPWTAAYASARIFAPRQAVRFVLGASGHIAGSINPPVKNKRSFWSGPAVLPEQAEQWLAQAQQHPGSWWVDWDRWLAGYGGGEVAAPKQLGNAKFKPIEPAPGRYVKEAA